MIFISPNCVILLLIILQTGIITHVRADAQCYFRDGSEADKSSYKPCFSDNNPNGACCSTAKTNGASVDICLENGLCYVQDSSESGMLFMDACTDKEWDSEKCPVFCSSAKKKDSAYAIIPCPTKGRGFWCCSESDEDCCENATRISMPPLATATPAVSTSPASNSPVATSTSTRTNEQCEDSKATSVGAGVGASLGACLLAMSAGLVFQNYAHKKRLQSLKKELGLRMGEAEPISYGQVTTFQYPSELENTQQVFEMGPQRR